MKALVLGGSQFVGRHVVEELLRAGHAVSIFSRGRSRDSLPPEVERLRGDRDQGKAGLDVLLGRTWDVCIDVSGYTPRQVRASASALQRQVGHYIFVSAVSVYGDPARGPVLETEPRSSPAAEEVTEVTRETYGPLKVTCENIVAEVFGERGCLLRPQIVAGPYDPLDRFSYWVRRAMQGGEMLAPGDGSDHVQVIDAHDLARFTRIVCEKSFSGSFNLAGPRLMWAEFVRILGASNVAWVPAEVLRAEQITEFELPLYRRNGGARSSLMHVGNERAVAAGLRLTETAATVESVRGWLAHCDLAPALSPQREAELITRSRGRVSWSSAAGAGHAL
jgi:2'-hydroxyisoflavone reductase